jgi:hypothetical protein
MATSVPVPIAIPTWACEGGRVVDVVARHGHHPSFSLEALYRIGFLFGEDLRDHLVDTELLRHGVGGRPVVARKHHDPDPLPVERSDRLRSRPFDGVRDADEPGRLSVHRHEQHGLAVLPQRFRFPCEIPRVDPEVIEEPSVAEANGSPVHAPRNAFPVDRFERFRACELDPAVLRSGDNGRRQRVLAPPLRLAFRRGGGGGASQEGDQRG